MGKNTTSFKKGTGGRPAGKPNKATGTLREWINSFIDGNREQIQEDWKALEPKDRLIMFERLLKYLLPQLQATSLTTDFEKLSNEDLDTIINELKKNNND